MAYVTISNTFDIINQNVRNTMETHFFSIALLVPRRHLACLQFIICIWKFPTTQISILIIASERAPAAVAAPSIYKLQLGVRAPFTLRAINNVCAKCINSFPSVEETISLRGGKPEVGVETMEGGAGSISLMGNEGHWQTHMGSSGLYQ